MNRTAFNHSFEQTSEQASPGGF